MSQTIPNLTTEPYSSLRVRLDDRDYTIELLYSTRDENYSLNLLDEENQPIVLGLKVFTGVPLLFCYGRDPRTPRGSLRAIALGADQSPPKLGELGAGQRVELTYYSEAELAALATSLA